MQIYDSEKKKFIERQGFNKAKESNDQTYTHTLCVNLGYRENEIED